MKVMSSEMPAITDATPIKLHWRSASAIAAVIAAAVIAWERIPSTDDVKTIAEEASKAAAGATREHDSVYRAKMEQRMENQEQQLRLIVQRLDQLAVIMVGPSVDSTATSPRAREATRRAKQAVDQGESPLDALP